MIDVQPSTTQWSATLPTDNQSIPSELLANLKQHSLFQRTNNDSFLEHLACSLHLRTYGLHDVIIKEGEQAKAMFFLLRGSVDVCSADFERIYATLPKGSCFGEIGILFSMPRTATVIAREKCTVAALTAEEVASILPHYPDVEKVLRFEAEERLAMLNKSLTISPRGPTIRRPSAECNVEAFHATGARDHLQKISYFKDCPEDFLHAISLMVEPRCYIPRSMIIRKGDQGTELYFIITGTVEVTTWMSDQSGRKTCIARLGPGDYFGEIGILLNVPRTATVNAITSVEVYVLKREDFLKVCYRYPDLLHHFEALAQDTLKDLEEKVQSHAENDVDTVTEGSEFVPVQEQTYGAPLVPIQASSVCSTTSDIDPTLLPTATNVLRDKENRKRRASVAVWADPQLLAVANKSRITVSPVDQLSPKGSPKSRPSGVAMDTMDMTQEEFPPSGQKEPFMGLSDDCLIRIVRHLDLRSVLQLLKASRNLRRLPERINVFSVVDLAPFNRKVTDDSVVEMAHLFKDQFTELSLGQCFHLSDTGLATLVAHASNLQSLDLNSCWLLTDQSLTLLAASCPLLTKLDLSNCRKITNHGLLTWLEKKAERRFGGLIDLTLSYCKNLTDLTMGALVEFSNTTLRSLNLQRCTKITDEGFRSWNITVFPALEEIVLTDCSFLTDEAIANLVAAAPNLRRLSISFCCALSDTAIEEVAKLQWLEVLDASFCGAAVSDASVHTLFDRRKDTLTELNIRGCVRITDALLSFILDAKHLRYLNISQCPAIGQDTKHFLQDTMSDLHLTI
ncbi:uncharacterized protein BYT42DRAFT_579288 [Radiomyces spectabilis]|uniref:uncharacterized protein n=1 Tax=Radiomyces spectabilis TaxID=64574 RepID=UPI002220675A|nr:uncharacterized protein BYT42DRAFT_579288 [Radiomyces spectabilis]KAI8373129.1 hypothetical protein BYT42DRAFT_579288 [Radiomyces spectabilis]